MRIIAGTKKGMRLQSPSSDISRPILDRVKESLFSVLYRYDLPEGKRVADVFSGVGSMGLEALSRGASWVTFVEMSHEIGAILQKNIEKAGFVKESKVIRANAVKVGAPVDFGQPEFDLVFVDPPYPMTREVGLKSPLAKILANVENQIVEDGLVVVRTHFKTDVLDEYGRLKVIERRSWGKMNICLLRLKADE